MDDSGAASKMIAGLLANLPGMVYRCLFDESLTMQFISQGCLALTGYLPDDLIKQTPVGYRELVFAEDVPEQMEAMYLAVQYHQPYRLIYRIRTARGQELWVREEGAAVYAVDGTVEALEGVVSDHSEHMAEFKLLEQRVADRTRRLSALYDILEAANDAENPQATIVRILRRVLKAIRVDAGALHLVDNSGEYLQLVAQQGLSESLLDSSSTLTSAESPLAGWVARYGELLFIPRIGEDTRSMALAEQSSYNVYIGVPITAAGQIYGVLSVLAHEADRFSAQEEIDLLVSVGEQIGAVVENSRLRQQAEQIMIVEERNRLARELHDSVTQSLYSVMLFAEAGRRMIAAGETQQAAGYLNDMANTSQQALKEMRLLVHRLRPSVLAKEGLASAIQHRLNAVEGRAGITTRFVIEGESNLAPAVEEALYYITQEALNNALKHGQASEVTVSLKGDEKGKIELQIKDNGKGFDPGSASTAGGLGLTSMKERAELFGGTVTFISGIGQGTTLVAIFDLSNASIVGAGFLGYLRSEQ